MLVCSHCQFENPDSHRFCQQCGTSLTDIECSVCGAEVAFDSEYCLHCGAVTGTTWKAILSPTEAKAYVEESGVVSEWTELLDPTDPPSRAIALPVGKFLDAQDRYHLLEPLPQQISIATEVEVRVLDTQPLQPSRWHQTHSSDGAAVAIEQEEEKSPLPQIANLYIRLREQFPLLSLPQLHDAWQQQDLDILLLEDRSHLPLLVDLWLDEDVLPLQILHWLHEMAELWAALEPYGCCRSLLDLSNLRIDEDYLLCLQRLYFDFPHQPAQLKHLGNLWQRLFQQSQRTHNAELAWLCAELDAGVIDSPAQLRSRIEAIATTLQSYQTPPVMPSTVPPDESNFPPTPESIQADSTRAAKLQPQQPTASPVFWPDGVEADTAIDPDEADNEPDDMPTVVLAMRLISIEDSGITDIGRQRDHNEDCFSLQTEIKTSESPQGRSVHAKGLYILCDGMGGHASGEVASALAVETLQQYFVQHWQDQLPNEAKIREAIRQANHVIFDLNQKNASAGSGRMGTTLVVLLIHNTEAAIAHVGDSRLYRLSRRRGLQQLTVDHEVGQREIQRGVEPSIAYGRPDAYQLTQALGPRDENFLSPDVQFFELNEDGILLLCSDGLSDNDLLETHWQSHLEPMLDQRNNLEQGVQQLIRLANHHNGHDNITAIAVRIKVRPNLDQVSR